MAEAAGAGSSQSRLIEVQGVFNQSAALRIREVLMEDHRSRSMTLDFTRATEFDDALALLAVSLVVLHRRGRKLRIRGLPQEPRASLLHFGISIEPDGEVEFLLREELPFSD
jgi:hypothetical protein